MVCALWPAGARRHVHDLVPVEVPGEGADAHQETSAAKGDAMSKPESETDPWAAIQRYELMQTNFAYTTDHDMERDAEGEWARWEAVDAARAAEAAQHQQEMARLRALMLSDEDRIVELLAERDRLKAALEQVVAAYQMALRSTEGNERPAILAMKAAYLASRAALSGEGTKP